jgi:hypothetical protein
MMRDLFFWLIKAWLWFIVLIVAINVLIYILAMLGPILAEILL